MKTASRTTTNHPQRQPFRPASSFRNDDILESPYDPDRHINLILGTIIGGTSASTALRSRVLES